MGEALPPNNGGSMAAIIREVQVDNG